MTEEFQADEDALDAVEDDSSDDLLSEEEKDALLEGVNSGVIGSERPDSASVVVAYEIRPDAYINYGSYPRLQGICQQWAKRTAQRWSSLLKCPISMTAEDVYTATYAAAITKTRAPVITALVEMAPLPRHAIVIVDNNLLSGLVEGFFGFVSHESDVREEPSVRVRQQFTGGELRVSDLALQQFVDALPDAWEKLLALQPSIVKREYDPTVGCGTELKERVVVCKFLVQTGTHNGYLHFLMPYEQIASIADDLEGATNARNPTGDPRWRDAMSEHLTETRLVAHVRVGRMRLPLRKIVSMRAGDLLPLEQPEVAELFVGETVCAAGGFGTLVDNNAFQMKRWTGAKDSPASDKS